MKLHFEEIDSTNKYLKEHNHELDDLTFVSADYQTEGKGRETRKWISNKGENLLFSILIKNQNIIKNFSSLSVCIATCVATFIEENLHVQNVSVKWPNDVYIKEKKVCGILLEGSLPNYIVIGIGLNVNQETFSNDLRHPATSLSKETGKTFNLDTIKEEIFTYIHSSLTNFDSLVCSSRQFLKDHNYLYGKEVVINEHTGIVTGLNDDFKLILNNTLIVDSGEASVLIK